MVSTKSCLFVCLPKYEGKLTWNTRRAGLVSWKSQNLCWLSLTIIIDSSRVGEGSSSLYRSYFWSISSFVTESAMCVPASSCASWYSFCELAVHRRDKSWLPLDEQHECSNSGDGSYVSAPKVWCINMYIFFVLLSVSGFFHRFLQDSRPFAIRKFNKL